MLLLQPLPSATRRKHTRLLLPSTRNLLPRRQRVPPSTPKILVPVTLEKPANNYGRWRSLFLVVLGKYNLKDHVLSDGSYPD